MYREMPTFQPDEILEYMRKSRSDDPTLTIEEVLANHNKKLNEWIERNLPAPIPEINVYREVVSGETIQSRPKFKELLKRIESPKIKAVLVLECERLGRPDLEEIGKISKLFRYTNTVVITPQRIFDLRDEWDREQFEREMMRGKDYLEYTKKVLTRGKEISLRSGFYVNGVYPYGYTREWVMDGKRERPSLAIVEDEAKVVRMVFDWYANEGIGATKICQRLNAMGTPARKGGLWKKSSIVNMLKNEHYIGKVVIKKHIDVNTVEDSTITTHCVFNPDFELVDGKHPAIIDEDTFNRANNKIHRYPSVKPSTTLQNPFASILRCECGKVMFRKKNRNTFRYLCDEQMFCGNASVGEKELTDAIIEGLKKNLKNLSAQVTNDDGNKKEKHTEYVSLLESRYVEIEKKELSLWDKYSEEGMPKQVFDKLMAKCMEEKQNLENALEKAYNDVPQHKDYKSAIATLHQAIETLGDSSVPASAKNKLLLSVVDEIVYKRPKAIRMSVEEAKEKGVTLAGGWYCPDFELDIHLKI
jgi:DNA invertase Pin-like site-specific DNA recombinase